jgi:hypothetical protein
MVVRPREKLTVENFKSRVVGEVSVLAWPMDRFYNHGDPAAAQIDWADPKLRVLEKLDGTMIVLYWDPEHGKWHCATRSVSEADVPIKTGDMALNNTTFSELFWRAYLETTAMVCARDHLTPNEDTLQLFVESTCDSLNKNVTYVWELTSPYNRVVVRYDVPRVTLLAMRDIQTGKELDPADDAQAHMELPKSWPIHNVEALVAFVDSADPAVLEGAVVIDSKFNRLKVKNKSWVLSSKAKDLVTVSRRSALEAIILDKIDDILPLIEKDIADELNKMRDGLVLYMQTVDRRFAAFKNTTNSRKEFALAVNASGDWPTPYFNLYEGRETCAMAWLRGVARRGKLSPTMLDTILAKIKI